MKTMTKRELQKRFDTLGHILNVSRDRGYFNWGQRTCINMERAAILRAQDVIDLGEAETAKPSYTIPRHLEAKCQQVLKDFKQ